jgi:hypothetical protein
VALGQLDMERLVRCSAKPSAASRGGGAAAR